MNSWQALPDAPLRSSGAVSAAFVEASCADFRSAARLLNSLPYGRNSSRADFSLVLREQRGTCSTKHALLAALAAEQGVQVSLRLGIYEMNEANTPGVGRVLARYSLDALPEAHCYVAFHGHRIDITRDIAACAAEIVFLHEETITSRQIGEYKLAVHRRFMREWLDGRRSDVGLTLDQLWRIREECIDALSA